MKITSVDVFILNTEGIRLYWHPVVIRINTSTGVCGVGEVGLAYGAGHSAGAAMIKELAQRLLIGSDPLRTEKIWDNMFRKTFWGLGGGPVIYGAMSAIDIALWDIKGKILGVPVYQLLGGKTNEKLRAYASQIQFGWDKGKNKVLTDPKDYADAALKAVSEGYTCVKVDPVYYDEEGKRDWDLTKILNGKIKRIAYERIKCIREAVGPDIDIILELHSALSTTSSIQLGKHLEEFDCMLMEEPVHTLNNDLMDKVSKKVRIPMAGGERVYTRWGYRKYLEQQSIDVIQPDLCLVGGITEGKKICDYAAVYDTMVQVHVCGSPVATAAALQLEAAISNFFIHEHHLYAIKPGNIAICRQDYQPQNGYFEIPDAPGIGVELNEDMLAKADCIKVS